MAGISNHLEPELDFNEEVTHREIFIIACQMDSVGGIESAPPGVFLYAVQEVLRILLTERSVIAGKLGDEAGNIYPGLLDAAFQMRDLTVEQNLAFWTSGYESDQAELLEAMRRSRLPATDPGFQLPPHLQQLRGELRWKYRDQVKVLHRMAQSGNFDKNLRRQLLAIRFPDPPPSAR